MVESKNLISKKLHFEVDYTKWFFIIYALILINTDSWSTLHGIRKSSKSFYFISLLFLY